MPARVRGIVDHDDARVIARGRPVEQAAKEESAHPSEAADFDAALGERGEIRTRRGPAPERIIEQAAPDAAGRRRGQRSRQLAPQSVRSNDEALDVDPPSGAANLPQHAIRECPHIAHHFHP